MISITLTRVMARVSALVMTPPALGSRVDQQLMMSVMRDTDARVTSGAEYWAELGLGQHCDH